MKERRSAFYEAYFEGAGTMAWIVWGKDLLVAVAGGSPGASVIFWVTLPLLVVGSYTRWQRKHRKIFKEELELDSPAHKK